MRQFLTIAAFLFTTAILAAKPGADQAAPKERSASGSFVSFKEGTLLIKSRSGLLTYEHVGTNYTTFQNNEDGPGSKLVDSVDALGRGIPGMLFQVNVENHEISFGLDHRVIGGFESYQNGKLNLLAADVPPGFVQKPAGNIVLAIEPGIPVLESIEGGDYQYAGPAGQALKTVKKGTVLTARSEFDPASIEVIQLGTPKRQIERYIGQTRATVRGKFVVWKDGVLRIQGKGITSQAANEYDRVINLRIPDRVPIVESIDGGAYEPAGADALKAAKEGTIVTIRKVEEFILEVQVGVAKTK